MGTAIRGRWPLSEEARAAVVGRLMALLGADEDRVAVSAAKALIDADRLNLQQEVRDDEAGSTTEEIVVRRVARRIDHADG